jgi:hypothetical protein
MDYYALMDENNKVLRVITGRNHKDLFDEVSSWEDYYEKINQLKCKRTCLHTSSGFYIDPETGKKSKAKAFRKNGAGVDYIYDEDLDAFIPPKLYPSWVLDEETCNWNPPIPYPTDDKRYIWNEDNQNWEEVISD